MIAISLIKTNANLSHNTALVNNLIHGELNYLFCEKNASVHGRDLLDGGISDSTKRTIVHQNFLKFIQK